MRLQLAAHEMCLPIYREASGSKRRGRFGKGFNAYLRHAACSMQRTCRPNYAPLWRRSRSPAGDWSQLQLDRRRTVGISSITRSCFRWSRALFIIRDHWSWTSVIERPQQQHKRMRGLCIQPWGFLNHISALARLVVFSARIVNTYRAKRRGVCRARGLFWRRAASKWLTSNASLVSRTPALLSDPTACIVVLCGNCWAHST